MEDSQDAASWGLAPHKTEWDGGLQKKQEEKRSHIVISFDSKRMSKSWY